MQKNNFLAKTLQLELPLWTVIFPILGLLSLLTTGFLASSPLYALVLGGLLIAAVLSAVHHAEVIAHKVGEPYGTIILALAVTVIEVSLIVSLMLAEDPTQPSYLARDTVFAAIMIILTGIIGICLLTGGFRYKEQRFITEGVSSALITLIAISVLTMILPNFTTSAANGEYSSTQLIFVAAISLLLYGGFISMQTIRHRDYFLPENKEDECIESKHAEPANNATVICSFILLIIALVGVILLSKTLSPSIESMVVSLGAPKSLVGIIIATVILLPEGLAAYIAAKKDRLQTSLNLALGSALASIGLTIPAVAIVCYFTDMHAYLGLDGKSIVLLITSLSVVYVSLDSGKSNLQQGLVLITLFFTYLFITVVP